MVKKDSIYNSNSAKLRDNLNNKYVKAIWKKLWNVIRHKIKNNNSINNKKSPKYVKK